MSMVTVRGVANREVVPDRALLSLVLEAVAEGTDEALRLLAERSGRLDGVLNEAAQDVAVRRPSAVRIGPRHDPGPRGPILRGQAAQRTVVVELRATAEVGALISRAVAESGARVNALQWAVDEDNPAHGELRAVAVRDARQRAETYAGAAGMRLGPLRWLAEPGLAPEPVSRSADQRLAFTAAETVAAHDGGEPPVVDLRPEGVRLHVAVEASYGLLPSEEHIEHP